MPDSTIIYWKDGTTVADLKRWLQSGDETSRLKIADLVLGRFEERYFTPVIRLETCQRNGFFVMAVACLVVEALEAFHQGWESSSGRSQLAFCSFFDREGRFHEFKGYAQPFYRHVRCGILHQAETTGGWIITRVPGAPLFNRDELTVNAQEFHDRLHESLNQYVADLKANPISSDLWKACKSKLKALIENCS